MSKPSGVFDRDWEWERLEAFMTADEPGSSLAILYGRRRMGKTFLLEELCAATGGLYFVALQQSEAQNLARLAEAYQTFARARAPVVFANWDQAIEALLGLGERSERPVPVVLDEFPYLRESAPHLESVIAAQLSPRGKAAREWRTRLVLCGSALSVMRGMLSGSAALRGRAAVELLLHPFDYRSAATYWGLDGDPVTAMALNALVGGTPAYLDMTRGRPGPAEVGLDAWVVDTLLDPSSAMFREGRIVLSEESRITDIAAYFAVLAAIAAGNTRRGEIAAAVGKGEGALAHPLDVLVETGLVTPLADALRQRRTTFHIAEPVLRLHQLVIAPNEARLVRRHGQAVWAEVGDTVFSKIYGPHFEDLARSWCADHATTASLGGAASSVARAAVACRTHRVAHELDVVVTETRAGVADRVTSIGEAKWRAAPVDIGQLSRLDHVRAVAGLGESTKLLLFSKTGFTAGLEATAGQRDDVELVDLERLYRGS